MTKFAKFILFLSTLVELCLTSSSIDQVQDVVFELLDLYKSNDLVIFRETKYYDSHFIKTFFKDPNIGIQTSILDIGRNYSIPDKYFGSAKPSLKWFFLLSQTESLEKVISLSMEEIWTDVNAWLLTIPWEHVSNAESVRQRLKDLNLDYMSRVYVVPFSHKNATYFVIYEAFKISKDDEDIQVLSFGNWSDEGGVKLSQDPVWHRRIDLRGKHFKVSALPNVPYGMEVQNGCQNKSCFWGIFPDVWHELQRKMNFTYTVQRPPDGQWGAKRENGTWTGIIGQLSRHEVDISAADFMVTLLRSPVVDYLPPLDEPHLRIFIANPVESYNFHAYIRPFTLMVWVAIFMFILAVPPVLYLILSKGIEDESLGDFGLASSFVVTAGTFVFRPWPSEPRPLGSRSAFFSILFLGTSVFYHWQGGIISYLSVRTVVLPFHSLEELMYQSDYKLLLQYGTAFVDNFKYAESGLFKEVWEKRIEPYVDTYPKTKDEMTLWIHRDRSFAMLDNFVTRSYYQDYVNCSTVDVPRKYFPGQFAMPMAKGSEYFQAFKFHTYALKETGALDQIKARYKSPPQECTDYSGKSLGFSQTFTAFVVPVAGAVISLLILCLELARGRDGRSKMLDRTALLEEMKLNQDKIEMLLRRNDQLFKDIDAE